MHQYIMPSTKRRKVKSLMELIKEKGVAEIPAIEKKHNEESNIGTS